jgi:urease accessory protein
VPNRLPTPNIAARIGTPWAAAALLALVPAIAGAHVGDTGHAHDAVAGLRAGFGHPFSGTDHLLAMVVLGAWSALALRRVWLAPLAFVAALLVGALAAMAGIALPGVEPMIAASLLALGLLTATRARLPMAAGMSVAALFALFHGAAHGQALQGAYGAAALAGMLAATALLHLAGIGLGLAVRRRSVWLPRLAGAAVALFGTVLLVPAFA